MFKKCHLRTMKDAFLRHSALLCSILLLTALSPYSAHAGSLEGYWYGNGYQPSLRKTMQWLTRNNSNGSFSVEFRSYRNCQLESVQQEAGEWSVSGDVMKKTVLTINGRPVRKDPYFTDTFKILKLDELKLHIVHEKSGQKWTLKRVTADFTFPDCERVS